MQDKREKFAEYELTNKTLKCCFDVMNSLGSGFLESVYKNALIIALLEDGLTCITDKAFEVIFRHKRVGIFIPDIIVENKVIVELKCCEHLLPEHQAQLINYLTVTDTQIGLLVNFGKRRLEYKRLHHHAYPAGEADPAYPVSSFPPTELQLN